jgi:hypothetical protein
MMKNIEDRICMVAIELEPGEEATQAFTLGSGYKLSEVEDIGEGRRVAWYFADEPSETLPPQRERVQSTFDTITAESYYGIKFRQVLAECPEALRAAETLAGYLTR